MLKNGIGGVVSGHQLQISGVAKLAGQVGNFSAAHTHVIDFCQFGFAQMFRVLAVISASPAHMGFIHDNRLTHEVRFVFDFAAVLTNINII
jgi:hypothetical protein